MKKLAMLLLLATTVLTACKKDKKNNIEGRWDAIQTYSVSFTDGEKTFEDTEPFETGETYIIFKGDDYTVYQRGIVDETGKFSSTESSITFDPGTDDSMEAGLSWKNSNEIVIKFEDTEDDGGKTIVDRIETTLKRN